MSVTAYTRFTDAQTELSRLIAARYGGDPSILDDLTVKSVPVKIEGSDKQALALFAHPAGGVRTIDDVLMVIVAKPDIMPLILAKGEGQA